MKPQQRVQACFIALLLSVPALVPIVMAQQTGRAPGATVTGRINASGTEQSAAPQAPATTDDTSANAVNPNQQQQQVDPNAVSKTPLFISILLAVVFAAVIYAVSAVRKPKTY